MEEFKQCSSLICDSLGQKNDFSPVIWAKTSSLALETPNLAWKRDAGTIGNLRDCIFMCMIISSQPDKLQSAVVRTPEYDKSIQRIWEIHLIESVPNWRKRLGRWFLFEFWMRLLFLIRNTEFMCCTIQICAQHGSHNENFPWKMAPKFNWALSGGSFSRLTFQVRRRTCLGQTHVEKDVSWK